ncbi:MAG TPA: sigma-70 family RNA polymerase sigma factor [Phycisphaerae bacterium]|nr:sigma-70 family RNA polymerase sigma factor [Phycisphaerae bacterium]
MATDIELLTRLRGGDRAAMDELYTRYLPVVWRYAFAQLRPDEAAARDAVSETFLAMMTAAHDPARGTVVAWIMGIARHKIADARRRRGPETLGTDIAAAGVHPAMPLATEETRTAVAQIIAALADEERLALEWKYLDGASVKEIAARLGRTERGVESLLFRARAEFRRRAGFLLDAKGNLK